MLTAVTLSERPWELKSLTRTVRYQNLVGTYETYAELHAARMRAIRMVDTEVFFFQDTDDPLPSRLIQDVGDLGYVRGPIRIIDYGLEETFIATYQEDIHHVVRAFLNTEKAKQVVQYLPEGDFDTFVLLHHFLDKAYGSRVESNLDMLYRKLPLGMNRLSESAIHNSLKWIALHNDRILSYLQNP